MVGLTSITTPPVGLPSHCIGISKFAGGSPPTLASGTHDAIIDGGAKSVGHGSCADRSTRTTVPDSGCDDAIHELKCLATSSAREIVRFRIKIFRHPSCSIA